MTSPAGVQPMRILMADSFRISAFSVDVTIPLGHRCMGLLPTKSKEIVDPLQAHGFVLQGPDKPVVLVAVDWCEIRNEAYDRWRNVIAEAVGIESERVLVSSLHQHDAPVSDIGCSTVSAWRVNCSTSAFTNGACSMSRWRQRSR